ncbi:MAG: glycosyltransferase [Dehalococcoidia bacterium]|nr:glycosyltransferase [Dehalococcoidia bacterium]
MTITTDSLIRASIVTDAERIITSAPRVSYKIPVSIGICAYNEEKNIFNHLVSLQSQKTDVIGIKQIVVVSSACTDQTDDIVENFIRTDPRIQLVKQAERKGKSSAVNLFLERATEEVCVLVSADTYLPENTIETLCSSFLDPSIGIVGGHPVPLNQRTTFMGFVSHFIWGLAHEISLDHPKLGELIAFRNIVDEIPEESAVDEASIEAVVIQNGYSPRYVPEAVVYNKGPQTVSDYIKQRRRIHAGHIYLKRTAGYEVSTMSSIRLANHVARLIRPNPKSVSFVAAAVLMEAWSRLLGFYDFCIAKKNPCIWEIATSTKVLVDGA